MTPDIAILLAQDGVTNGAIYALLAVALILVYTVTRVLFVPQGELVTYGALTFASLQQDSFPTIAWLLLALGILVVVLEVFRAYRSQVWRKMPRIMIQFVLLPFVICALFWAKSPHALPTPAQIALTVIIVSLLGPSIYRLAFASIAARASVLSLLIVALAVHFVLVGLGLFMFGPEGFRAHWISDANVQFGAVAFTMQSMWIIGSSGVMIIALHIFFDRTILGQSLRATAVNRFGARLVGIRTETAGELAFALAALIGAISGVLISLVTTLYYDTGFLIGLKGLIAAIIAALVSYPAAGAAAILVGLIEVFSSFFASAYKEAILFAAVLPFLIWRSLNAVRVEEEDEDEE